jgi:alpha-glucosidase
MFRGFVLLSLGLFAGWVNGEDFKPFNGTLYGEQVGAGICRFLPSKKFESKIPPSLALAHPVEKKGELPADWSIQPTFSKNSRKILVRLDVDPETDFYGGGEVTGPLNRKGTRIELWNTDNFTYMGYGGFRLYQSHPWIMGVRKDGSAFGVLFDTTWKSEMALTNGIEFATIGPAFPVYVIDRSSPQEVLKGLAELIGTIQLPPLWALGYQQCRWSYNPDSRVREIADGFRSHKIPCDVIWMDIDYMDGFRVFTFSPKEFPDPKATCDYLHERGFKGIWMIDPGVKAEPGYFVYDSGTTNKVWVETESGEEFHGKVWPGMCAFPDFTSPEVRQWWADLYKDFLAVGVDGIWNDMNEPALMDNKTFPDFCRHRGGDGLPPGPHLQYHNVYGMLMARATQEGLLQTRPEKRPFVLTRSNFLGGQRYAATWTGDNKSTWDQMKISLPMSLTLGLSGQPFNGPDVGGFAGMAEKELYGQWISMGAFYPFFRGHACKGTNDKEPWAFGKKIEEVARTAFSRRYRLMPYLYTLFREASVNGLPVMRPVFMADPKDLSLRNEQQVFLLGADLLVVPKWAESPALPKGDWRVISLVGENSETDRYQADLRIRAGAIIPLGKVIQNTTEKSLDPLTLLVCPDENGEAIGTLYEDEYDGFGYQKGHYLLTTYKATLKNGKVRVEILSSEGKMPRPKRTVRVVCITDKGTKTTMQKGL